MLKLAKYLKPYWLQIVAIIALVYVQVQTDLALPDYMARIVNQGIVLKDNTYIWNTGITMLLVALLGAVCTVIVSYFASRVAVGFAKDIRAKTFTKVESFSLVEFNRFSTASLITRSTNDIQQIQMVMVMILRFVLYAPILGFGAILKANQMAPSMTWIMGLAVATLVSIIVLLFSIALPKFQALQKLVDKLNLVTRQILTGIRVIRAFDREQVEAVNFDKANRDLTDVNLFVNRLMVVMQPFMMLIFNVTALAVIWVGSHLINTGNLQIGDMVAFLQYSMQVIMAFLMISIVFIMVPRASVSGARVAEVLESEPTIKNPTSPIKSVAAGTGVVEFKDVSFAYPGAKMSVLCNVSFVAKPGETTAFIGSTGSGKSTLINLIPRFYDVTEGQVLIDGVDVRQMNMEDLYAKLGYVPQKGVLFSGTVDSNIKYGAPHASDEQIAKAARIAQATEFVEQLEDKYTAPIAQGGTNVSGGQKQRLSIARAVVRDPEIFIFDDSFSAVDFKTDAALRAALKAEINHKTVLIVAQRISTILDADQIVVLNEGNVVGKGRHADLMKTCPVYQEIARSQLSEKELSTYAENHTQSQANTTPLQFKPILEGAK